MIQRNIKVRGIWEETYFFGMIYYSTKGINIIGLCKKNFIKYESCKGSECNPNLLFHKFFYTYSWVFDQIGFSFNFMCYHLVWHTQCLRLYVHLATMILNASNIIHMSKMLHDSIYLGNDEHMHIFRTL